MIVAHDLLERGLHAHPGQVAVRDRRSALTYRELDTASLRGADRLVRLGVRRGDRVVIALGSNTETVATILAVLRAGAAFVVLDPNAPAAALDHVLADCSPAAVVAGEGHPLLSEGGKRRWSAVPPASLLSEAGADAGARLPTSIASDLACLIYTSGSTGWPKGVMSRHSNVVFATEAIAARLDLGSDAVIGCLLPLTFDYGLYQVFLALHAGATVVLGEGADAGPGIVGFLRWSGADVLPIVPSTGRLLLRLLRRERDPLPPLRVITSTGERLSADLIDAIAARFPAARIYPMYGLTECKRVSILTPEELEEHPGSVGRALDGTECLVVDPLTRRELPAGEVGELVVRGPHVMPGYWRAPDLTAVRYRPWGPTGETVLFTGDLGSRDGDGFLFFHGRSDDIVKMNGRRVGLLEIEAAAAAIEGVDSAIALPPDDGRPVTLVAVTSLSALEVRAKLTEQIEPFKVPEAIDTVESVPLTRHGKVDRASLLDRLEAACS